MIPFGKVTSRNAEDKRKITRMNDEDSLANLMGPTTRNQGPSLVACGLLK